METDRFSGRSPLLTFSAAALLVLALFYTLDLAQSLFMPVVLALLLSFLLSPGVSRLRHLGYLAAWAPA